MPVEAASLLVKVGADVGGAVKGLQTVDNAVGNFVGGVGRMGVVAGAAQAITARAFDVTGRIVQGAIGGTIGLANDFNATMSGVAAVSGATGAQIAQMGQMAIQFGADAHLSGVGASDAARSMEELAKGGVNVADIMGGAARGALLLASAGGIDFADAATIAADAMNIFGLSGAQIPHVADLFAAAANSSSIEVTDVAQAMKQAGTVAAQFGLTIDDTTAAIAAFGAQGLKGSDAGTSMKTMLLSLANPTDKAKTLMDQYGLSFFDANGHMLSFAGIADQLQTHLAGLTDQQRAAVLETIFGTDAIRAASILYKDGAKGINGYAKQVGEAGSAERVAAARMDNLSGALENFHGTVETAGIKIGNALTPAVKDAVTGLTGFISAATNSDRVTNALARGSQALVSGFKVAVATAIALTGAFRLLGPAIRSGNMIPFLEAFYHAVRLVFGPGLSQFLMDAAFLFARALQLFRDSILTVRAALRGEWLPSDQIQPFVNFLGIMAVAMRERVIPALRDLGSRLLDAGRGFAAVFTPDRLAIIRQMAVALLNMRIDLLVLGIRSLATILPPVIDALGRLVGSLIDFAGWIQASEQRSRIFRDVLVALGTYLALNQAAKGVVALQQFGGAVKQATALTRLWNSQLLTLPRLVVTTIRTVYQTVGKAVSLTARAAGTITRVIKVAFASAQDAAIWAQLYTVQAAQTITRTIKTTFSTVGNAATGIAGAVTRSIKTVWEAIPKPPPLPDLKASIKTAWETIPQPKIPEIPTVQIKANVNVPAQNIQGSGTQAGAGLARSLAGGFAGSIGALLVSAGPEIGSALAAAAPYVAIAALAIAAVVAAVFVARLIGGIIAAHGGLGPAIYQLFAEGIPFALGALAGLVVNAGLQIVLWTIQGVTQGIPALIGFVRANFQTVVLTVLSVVNPLLPLIAALVAQIGPIVGQALGNVIAVVADAASQIAATLAAAWAAILAALGGAWAAIVATIQGAIGQIVGILQGMASQVIAAVQAAFAPLGDLISAIMQGDWGAAVSAGIDLIVNLFFVLPGQLLGIVGDAFSGILGVIGDAMGQVASIIGDTLGQVVSIVGDAWGQIGDVISSAADQIQSIVSGAFDAVQATISNIVDGITSYLSTAWSNMVAGFDSTFNGALLASVGAAMTGLLSSISNGVDQAVALVGSLPGRALGALGDLAGALFNAGSQLIGGFISGIQSRIGEVQSTLAGLTNLLPSWKGPPEKDRVLLFENGRLVIQGFIEGMDDKIPDVAKKAAEVTKAVSEAIQAGIDAIKALREFDPRGGVGNLAGFKALADQTLAGMIEIASKFESDAIEAAGKFSDAAKKVFDLVGAGVQAIVGLRDAELPGVAAVLAFEDAAARIIQAFVDIATGMGLDGVSAAGLWAEYAGKVFGILKGAVEGLEGISDFVAPTRAAMVAFTQATNEFINEAAQLGVQMGKEFVAAANVWTGAAGKALGILGDGVRGLSNLRFFVSPTRSAMVAFTQATNLLINLMAQLGSEFDKRFSAAAATWSEAAKNALGVLGDGIDGIMKLNGFVAPGKDAADAFLNMALYVVNRFGQVAGTLSKEGIAQTSAFAVAAQAALGATKDGVDAFLAFKDLVVPSKESIDALLGGIIYVVKRAGEIARQIGEDGLQRAQRFADGARSVFDTIKAAVDLVGSLKDSAGIPSGALDNLLGGIKDAIGKMGGLQGAANDFLGKARTFEQTMRDAAQAIANGMAATSAGGQTANLPGGGTVTAPSASVPALASGGIVTRPTLALIGDGGPEAVIPLRRSGGVSAGDPALRELVALLKRQQGRGEININQQISGRPGDVTRETERALQRVAVNWGLA